MAQFSIAVEVVLRHEGGFVDNPADPGGATNFGISLRHLQKIGDLDGDGWLDGDFDRDGDVDVDDIANMTREDAISHYRSQFWDRYRYDWFKNQEVANKVFCLAVHAGPRRAAIILQKALSYYNRLDVDGIVGPLTRALTNTTPPTWLVTEFKHETAAFYRQLVETRPKLIQFERGWLNRAYA